MSTSKWRLSPAETARFGIQSARADDITTEDLPALDAFCRENDVQMLIARVSVHHLPTVQRMEADGFRLMDTLLTYKFDFTTQTIPTATHSHTIHKLSAADADRLGEIAQQSFTDYNGHYHSDPCLDRADCDAAYIDWARRSAMGELADVTFGIKQEGQVMGFSTFRMNSSTEGAYTLAAIAPEAQGQGMYIPLSRAGMVWCQEQGAEYFVVPTQITNHATQKMCVRLGMQLWQAVYTFHKWYDITQTELGTS